VTHDGGVRDCRDLQFRRSITQRCDRCLPRAISECCLAHQGDLIKILDPALLDTPQLWKRASRLNREQEQANCALAADFGVSHKTARAVVQQGYQFD
jgi:hypothetical protein